MPVYTIERHERWAYIRDALRSQETPLAYAIAEAFRKLQESGCYSVAELDAIAVVLHNGLRDL